MRNSSELGTCRRFRQDEEELHRSTRCSCWFGCSLWGTRKEPLQQLRQHISDLRETKGGGRRVAGIDRRVLLAVADDRWQTRNILLVVVRKQRWATSPGLDDGALSLRSHVPSVYCPNLPPWCLLVLGTRSRRCGGPAEAPELCTCAREFLCWVPPRRGKPGGDDI